MRYFGLFALFMAVNALALCGCATVPVSQRRQLSLIPSQQLTSLSNQSYDKIISESTLSKDPQKVEMVERVGRGIAAATEDFLKNIGREEELANYEWEFVLIEDNEQANAFCMPGGKVAVYTGILPFTKDETGLAVVLAHEAAHAIANHGGERLSQLLLIQLGQITLALALREKPEETQRLAYIAYGVTSTVGVILPYSRTHEREADRIGLIIMAKAGYDPREAIAFWERMKEQEKIRPPEFLSTHPVPESRIEDIKRNIPEAMRYYKKN
ncbi:MAG: M48 family metalloprotease [Candidatus Omnitrophica bacterium]|nr:M48 family metalloprotease [Candidatus Omnitrophota bacterium]MBD3269474.1 M48 family metalloprotease [Candidatus Omnitrophota bacterium]